MRKCSCLPNKLWTHTISVRLMVLRWSIWQTVDANYYIASEFPLVFFNPLLVVPMFNALVSHVILSEKMLHPIQFQYSECVKRGRSIVALDTRVSVLKIHTKITCMVTYCRYLSLCRLRYYFIGLWIILSWLEIVLFA